MLGGGGGAIVFVVCATLESLARKVKVMVIQNLPLSVHAAFATCEINYFYKFFDITLSKPFDKEEQPGHHCGDDEDSYHS